MFSGIVQGVGTVATVEEHADFTTVAIDLPSGRGGLAVGASVAIDGVCLTATEVAGDRATFDLIPETLARTTLDTLGESDRVNVERSLRFGDEIGGHILSGHVMTTGAIESVEKGEGTMDLTVRVEQDLSRFILEKGFIAIDGISLTVGGVDGEGCFDLHIIPETIRMTTLAEKSEGERVNVEIDATTQAVVEAMERYGRLSEGAT